MVSVAQGAALSGIVAALAWRLKALASSGAWAAWGMGTVLYTGGGWSWLLLVGAFFVPASALTRWTPLRQGSARRSQDSEGRRWDQVAANGGIATVVAAIHGLSGWPLGFSVAAGAIAAAAADTCGTELGRWSARDPRLITTGAPVSRGTSGGVTVLGTVGEAAGALIMATGAAILERGAPAQLLFLAVAVAGFSGALLDSLIGATIEGRARWIDNSAVNLLATAWGAAVVLMFSRWWR